MASRKMSIKSLQKHNVVNEVYQQMKEKLLDGWHKHRRGKYRRVRAMRFSHRVIHSGRQIPPIVLT